MRIPVIIADDHPFLRSGVESVLAASGYAVVAAVGTGREALAAIGRHDTAIAILDVRMPDGDGIAVLEALRARGDKRPVVLLTAELENSKLLAALDAGVDGIVMKEGGESRLIGCLEKVRAGGQDIPEDLLERARGLCAAAEVDPFRRLNTRDALLARLVATGVRNREIARQLGLAEGTIKVYLHGLYRKLGVTTRTELALLVHRYGLE